MHLEQLLQNGSSKKHDDYRILEFVICTSLGKQRDNKDWFTTHKGIDWNDNVSFSYFLRLIDVWANSAMDFTIKAKV